jgi:hypothetical protein
MLHHKGDVAQISFSSKALQRSSATASSSAGPSIEDTARSLINGLLREDRLESNGSQIRRSG